MLLLRRALQEAQAAQAEADKERQKAVAPACRRERPKVLKSEVMKLQAVPQGTVKLAPSCHHHLQRFQSLLHSDLF